MVRAISNETRQVVREICEAATDDIVDLSDKDWMRAALCSHVINQCYARHLKATVTEEVVDAVYEWLDAMKCNHPTDSLEVGCDEVDGRYVLCSLCPCITHDLKKWRPRIE